MKHTHSRHPCNGARGHVPTATNRMTAIHDHAHHRHGDALHPEGRPNRALPWALAMTLGFAAVEAMAGWWSGSLALLGDAGHMLTDSLALALATAASILARRPSGPRHTYGLRRVETLAGMLNGLFMLVVVALIAWHAIERLITPQPVQAGTVIGVAALGLAINVIVAWMLSHGEGDLNTRAALLHVFGDLLGSVAALASGIVILYTGWYPADPLLSMLICGLILASTLKLLRVATHTLLEGVPDNLSLAAIGHAMAEVEGVHSIHDLHVWSLDSNHAALSAHVVLHSSQAWPTTLVALQRLLADQFGIDHATLQPEPLPGRIVTFSSRPPRPKSAAHPPPRPR